MDPGVQVLIADDGTHSRNGLRALLASLPAVNVVHEASNGQEAIRLVEDAQPDVVVMDVRMPELDGLRATRLIKRKWPQIRVIVLTLYATYLTEAMAAGADSFLVKGCPTEDLLNALLLDGQKASIPPQGYNAQERAHPGTASRSPYYRAPDGQVRLGATRHQHAEVDPELDRSPRLMYTIFP
jgi:DNA-binding NarL/FixJ family response regulator